MCWQQRVGWVGEGSGGKAGTSSCLHTLPLPSPGNATSTHNSLQKKRSLDFVWLITWTSLNSHVTHNQRPSANASDLCLEDDFME